MRLFEDERLSPRDLGVKQAGVQAEIVSRHAYRGEEILAELVWRCTGEAELQFGMARFGTGVEDAGVADSFCQGTRAPDRMSQLLSVSYGLEVYKSLQQLDTSSHWVV